MTPDVHTLAGPYALDAVDDIERAEFARHLAQCPACAVEVAELRATASRLADVVASAPPPGLRAAVLAEIRHTRQVGPWRRDSARPAGQVRWRRLAAVAAVAAVVAAGAGVTTYAVQEQRVRHAHAEAAEVNRIAAVLAASDARVRAALVTGGGQVRVVVSDAMNEGVAILDGLPAPGAGHTYQLWLLPPGPASPRNVGVLPAGDGRQLLTDLHGAGAFAVSRERGTAPVATPGQVVQRVPLL
jgi:hypothetical protein